MKKKTAKVNRRLYYICVLCGCDALTPFYRCAKCGSKNSHAKIVVAN